MKRTFIVALLFGAGGFSACFFPERAKVEEASEALELSECQRRLRKTEW